MEAAERYMRLALKAQSQCRATIETLAEMKNLKPVAFVHQANNANGPQQVSNGPGRSAGASRAREPENLPNKQTIGAKEQSDEAMARYTAGIELRTEERVSLSAYDGEWLDFRAKCATGATNTALETVGAVDWAEDDGRKGRETRNAYKGAVRSQLPVNAGLLFTNTLLPMPSRCFPNSVLPPL